MKERQDYNMHHKVKNTKGEVQKYIWKNMSGYLSKLFVSNGRKWSIGSQMHQGITKIETVLFQVQNFNNLLAYHEEFKLEVFL